MPTHRDVLRQLRRAVRAAGTQRAAARTMRISASHLNDVLHGRREPGPKLLRALGLTRAVRYGRESR